MNIDRDETEKTDFDEIIDEFAAIKPRKCCFKLACCVILTTKGWIYCIDISMELSLDHKLYLFYLMDPFNRYSQVKSPLRSLVCKTHFYISTLRKETKLFIIDKLNYITF